MTLSEAKAHKATCESQIVDPGYLTCRLSSLSSEECRGATEFYLAAASVAAAHCLFAFDGTLFWCFWSLCVIHTFRPFACCYIHRRCYAS